MIFFRVQQLFGLVADKARWYCVSEAFGDIYGSFEVGVTPGCGSREYLGFIVNRVSARRSPETALFKFRRET